MHFGEICEIWTDFPTCLDTRKSLCVEGMLGKWAHCLFANHSTYPQAGFDLRVLWSVCQRVLPARRAHAFITFSICTWKLIIMEWTFCVVDAGIVERKKLYTYEIYVPRYRDNLLMKDRYVLLHYQTPEDSMCSRWLWISKGLLCVRKSVIQNCYRVSWDWCTIINSVNRTFKAFQMSMKDVIFPVFRHH